MAKFYEVEIFDCGESSSAGIFFDKSIADKVAKAINYNDAIQYIVDCMVRLDPDCVFDPYQDKLPRLKEIEEWCEVNNGVTLEQYASDFQHARVRERAIIPDFDSAKNLIEIYCSDEVKEIKKASLN